jgi:Flp pilus assembly protein TadG
MTIHQRLPQAHAPQAHAERGAISVFLAVLVPGLFLVIGLAFDGGARVAATQRANAIADEAARAGGQALDVSAVLAGQVRVDPAAAVAAAQNYLQRNGVRGVVTVVDGDTLQVTTTITEPTAFLGLIGIDSWTVEGAGTAGLVTDVVQNGGVGP